MQTEYTDYTVALTDSIKLWTAIEADDLRTKIDALNKLGMSKRLKFDCPLCEVAEQNHEHRGYYNMFGRCHYCPALRYWSKTGFKECFRTGAKYNEWQYESQDDEGESKIVAQRIVDMLKKCLKDWEENVC